MSYFHRFTFPSDIDIYNTIDIVSDHNYSLEDMGYRAEDLFVRIFSKGERVLHIVTDESVNKSYIAVNSLARKDDDMISEMGANSFEESVKLAEKLEEPEDIYYATMASGSSFNDSVYHCLDKAVHHSDPNFRLHAITSTIYLVGQSWSSKIEALLSKAAKDDSVTENREAARGVLKALKKNNWNEGMLTLNSSE